MKTRLWPALGPIVMFMLAGSALAEQQYRVSYRDIPERVAAEGVVEAVRQSTLAAQVTGQVTERHVNVGDAVRPGAPLLRIDARVAEQALLASRSQVREAQATFVAARHAVERARRLHQQHYVSKAALDQAEAEYAAAQARVAALEAGAVSAGAQRGFTNITAPYAGVVAEIPAEVGDMAVPGTPLVTVFDPARLRVVATLADSAAQRIRTGAPVLVELAGRPPLKVERMTLVPLADNRSHTVQVRLDLPPATGLMPGQFVRALFATGDARRLAVPSAALVRRSELTAVYVIDQKGGRQLRQVRTGAELDEGMTEILSGLREGETVVAAPR